MTPTRSDTARLGAMAPALALAALLGSADAMATGDPAQAAPAQAAPAAAVPLAAPAERPARTLFATPVAKAKLGGSRGGAASSDTTGELRNTTASNVSGGANTVRDGSFANAAGLTTVIQNSGSNVLIQNSTTVNVQFRP